MINFSNTLKKFQRSPPTQPQPQTFETTSHTGSHDSHGHESVVSTSGSESPPPVPPKDIFDITSFPV